MSNQGLSIFDHEPDDSGDEATQVIPLVSERKADQAASGGQKTAQKVAARVEEKPGSAQAPQQPSAPTRPQDAPSQPARQAPPSPMTPSRSTWRPSPG